MLRIHKGLFHIKKLDDFKQSFPLSQKVSDISPAVMSSVSHGLPHGIDLSLSTPVDFNLARLKAPMSGSPFFKTADQTVAAQCLEFSRIVFRKCFFQ